MRESALARYLVLNLSFSGFNRAFFNRFKTQNASQQFVGNTLADANHKRIEDSKQAVDRFFEELPNRSGLSSNQVMFVMDGIRPQLYDAHDLYRVRNSYFAKMRNYFLQAASQLGYEAVDMQPVFIDQYRLVGKRYEFVNDMHWNALGHQTAAQEVEKSILYQNFLKHQRPIKK